MSKYVHDLVARMTMREKGYFKVYSSVQKNIGKNYLELYKFVEKRPVYNLDDVKRKFENTPITKHLSSTYRYLGEQLLKSLINYHLNSTDLNRIQKSILYIKILIEKDLKEKALKVLRQTKVLASQSEKFGQVLSLIDLEEELLFKQGVLAFTERLEELNIERSVLVKKINNIGRLRILREQVREFQMRTTNFSENCLPAYFHGPLLTSIDEALSVRAKEHWLYILAVRNGILKKFERSRHFFLKGISLVEDHSKVLKESKVLPLMSNYLYTCALLKDRKSFFKMLSRAELLKITGAEDGAYVSFMKYTRLFELYYQTNDIASSKNLEKEVRDFINLKSANLVKSQIHYLYFSLARSSMTSRRYRQAMIWLNLWNQYGVAKILITHNKLFSLIIHFELELTELLESEIDSTYKFLKRHTRNNSLTDSFLEFFRNYLKSPQIHESHLNKLNEDLTLLIESSMYTQEFAYFDYRNWAQQKISSRI